MNRKILVISDNIYLLQKTSKLIKKMNLEQQIEYASSAKFYNQIKKQFDGKLLSYDVGEQVDLLIDKYEKIISLHCQQIFPKKLVNKCRCINVHPGFNPYNRGWYPHVFSIINGLPAGATIHEMDEFIDNGAIIAQEMVVMKQDDTSETLYQRVQDAELELIKKYLQSVLNGDYVAFKPKFKGNLNTKKDFQKLCEIDLAKIKTAKKLFDILRALSHGEYSNARINLMGNKTSIFLKLKERNE